MEFGFRLKRKKEPGLAQRKLSRAENECRSHFLYFIPSTSRLSTMADSVPAVGSLISLISRTGIRYEGSMYTVDLSDSTIALSHGEKRAIISRAKS